MKYVIDTDSMTIYPIEGVNLTKTTIADIAETMLGAKEWDDTVTAVQKWFYGTMMKEPWCTTFISYCAFKALVSEQTGKYENVDSMKEFLNTHGRLDCTKRYGGGNYKPKRGDLIFFSSKHLYKDCTHVGAVVEINHSTGYVKAISGNSADRVRYTEHNYLTDPYVVAFGNITY